MPGINTTTRPGRSPSPWPISRNESYPIQPSASPRLRHVEKYLDLSVANLGNLNTGHASARPDGKNRLLCETSLQMPLRGLRSSDSLRSPSPAPSTGSSLSSHSSSSGLHTWYAESGREKVGDTILRQVVTPRKTANQARVSTLPGGVELVHLTASAAPSDFINKALSANGQSPYARHLFCDVRTGRLYDLDKKQRQRDVKDGRYAYVIDQDNRLLISIGAPATGNAPQGAHAKLVGGLPVRFAGELEIAGGKATLFTNQSGHYRPPSELAKQAAAHPLLREAVAVLVSA
jgi:hypothetical protein